jgi:hypothetical protein
MCGPSYPPGVDWHFRDWEAYPTWVTIIDGLHIDAVYESYDKGNEYMYTAATGAHRDSFTPGRGAPSWEGAWAYLVEDVAEFAEKLAGWSWGGDV